MRLDSLARRIIEALHKPVEIEGFGPSFFLTASIGVAFGRYATPDDMLRDAHMALFAAKAAGKDRYTLFNANMRSIIEGRGVLEVELNTALQEEPVLAALPARLRAVLAARGRARGAAALGAPDEGRGLARRVHPARRGERPDRPDRALGARTGLRRRPPPGTSPATAWRSP